MFPPRNRGLTGDKRKALCGVFAFAICFCVICAFYTMHGQRSMGVFGMQDIPFPQPMDMKYHPELQQFGSTTNEERRRTADLTNEQVQVWLDTILLDTESSKLRKWILDEFASLKVIAAFCQTSDLPDFENWETQLYRHIAQQPLDQLTARHIAQQYLIYRITTEKPKIGEAVNDLLKQPQ